MTASGLAQLEQLEHAFHWKFFPVPDFIGILCSA